MSDENMNKNDCGDLTAEGKVMNGTGQTLEEKIINAVRAYKHLYDKQSRNYMNRDVRENSWQEIAKSLELSVEDVRSKWEKIGSKFTRISSEEEKLMRSGAGAIPPCQWELYKSLEFLKDHITRRRRFSNLVNGTNDSQQPDAKRKPLQHINDTIDVDNYSIKSSAFYYEEKSNSSVPSCENLQAKNFHASLFITGSARSSPSPSSSPSIPAPSPSPPILTASSSSASPIMHSTMTSPSNILHNYAIPSRQSSSMKRPTHPNKKIEGSRKSSESSGWVMENTMSMVASTLATINQRYERRSVSGSVDEQFASLVAHEIAKKPEAQQAKMKKKILEILYGDDDSNS